MDEAPDGVEAGVVESVRRFNRHWTAVLGLLDQGILATEHTLTEARVLSELAQQGPASERMALRERLGLDASFLTRVLARMAEQGLVERFRSEADGRRVDLRLTDRGRTAYEALNARSMAQIEDLLAPLTAGQRATMADYMTVISHMVGPHIREPTVRLRALRPGDLGWIVQRHGEIYHDEFGWDTDFEGLVAGIVADYWSNRTPGREWAWVMEVDGARAGCVLCVQRDEATAQLRLLLVEPWAGACGSAPGWSTSASPSPAGPATPAWCSGPTTCSGRLGGSTRRPASYWSPRSGTTASGMTSSARRGSST